MQRFTRSVISLTVLCITLAVPGIARPDDSEPNRRDSVFERAIIERVAMKDTAAARLFGEATMAFDAKHFDEAREKYEYVLVLVPGLADAERRLSQVEDMAGNKARALYHADRACAIDSSVYNRLAVASAVLYAEEKKRYSQALEFAWRAVDSLPQDGYAHTVLLQAGLVTENDSAIIAAANKLVEVIPSYAPGHYFKGLVWAADGSYLKAENELLRARELGLDPMTVERALEGGIRTHANYIRWGLRGAWAIGFWAVGLVALFLVGMILSTATMRAVRRTQTTGKFAIGQGEQTVRRLYRLLILGTSAYFYISLPVLFVIVLAAGGGFLYAVLALGRIPIKLALLVGAGTLVTLYAIIRSIFVQSKDEDPGRRLSRDEATDLWKLTDDVARKVGTRPIEAIFLTPGTEVAVMERGSSWRKLRGQGHRCLILGLGALKGLELDPFKSILAHEYGHFSHGDTAGGNMAHQTNRSMLKMAMTLASNGLATWYNPAWWFIRGFNSAFMRITLGASRLQEILADRLAGMAYGARNFVNGLTHVIRQDLIFNHQLNKAYAAGSLAFSEITNLYDLPTPTAGDEDTGLDAKLEAVLSRPTTAFDSHPAPNERFALLEKMELPAPEGGGAGFVLSLLREPIELQKEMSAVIQKNVRHG